MKTIVLVLLLNGGLMLSAQAPIPSQPNGVPDPGKLFQFAPGANRGKPQFKLQIPNGRQGFSLPELQPAPRQPDPKSSLDSGIMRRPHGFVQQPTRPAISSRIYPDLKLLPLEMAQLEPSTLPWPQAKGEPIPLTWPNARIEPIPITWDGFRMAPVTAGSVQTATEK